MPHVVNHELCTGDAQCVDICPVQCITMEGDKAVIDPDECVDCGSCAETCEYDAITAE